MKIISVTNRKGGVGKSTMSVHIAAGLALFHGLNVGLVDTDSQGHASLMLNMPEENGLFNAMIERRPLEEVVQLIPPENYSTPDQPPTGNLYLLPSSDQTYKIPYELGPDEAFRFLEVMEDFGEQAKLDVILIDTNPTMSMFDGAIYMATDGFIYVTECERLSMDGIEKAVTQMLRFSKSRQRFLSRGSEIIGVIPNKLKANTVLHRQNIAELAQAFGRDKVWTPVIHRIAWAESANLQEPIYLYAPSGQEAADARSLTRHTMEALTSWQEIKTD